jgi:hypothetical protein
MKYKEMTLRCPYRYCNNNEWMYEEMLAKHMINDHDWYEGIEILAKMIAEKQKQEQAEPSQCEKDWKEEQEFKKWCKEKQEPSGCQYPQEHCTCFEIQRESYIPISKIEERIKWLEADNERLKGTNFSSFMNSNDTRIAELKNLLPKQEEDKK